MAKNYYENKADAEFWLKDKLDEGRIVFEKSELDAKIYNYLKANSLLVDLYSTYFFIKKDDISALESFRLFYWRIVIQFLNLRFSSNDNNPAWYLVGKYSYDFLIDKICIPDEKEQITIQTKLKSNTTIKLFNDHTILAVQDRNFEDKTVIKHNIFGDFIHVLKYEYMIINSSKVQYELFEANIVSYLKNKDFDFDYLMDYFKRHQSPVLLSRFIGALRQVDEKIQALKFENLYKEYGFKKAIENPFSKEYKLQKSSKPSFVTRFSLSMKESKDFLKSLELPKRLKKCIDAKSIEKLSADDAYHSLTIEGYEVTKEIILKMQSGSEVNSDLKNKSATKGFLRVLDFVKQLITIDYSFDQNLTEELWKNLWSPSINAGLFQHEVAIYRNHMVSIKGSQSVPPSHEKIFYLLEEFYNHANDFENGFQQAIFLHFYYVWIHPHSDGNGRISRFLMNLALIKDNYKWLTIPVYERKNYFAALEKSQIEDDISYFASYILELYNKDLEL